MTISLNRAETTSRTAMLADGLLVDVTESASRRGFIHPVAITRAAWDDAVHWDDAIEAYKRYPSAQDVPVRLNDVLWFAWAAVRTAGRATSVDFVAARVRTTTRLTHFSDVTLRARIHPDDDGRPVITISMPDED